MIREEIRVVVEYDVFYGLVFCFVIAPWNRESFGFFIDFGNGMMTIPPSLLANIAIVWPDKVSPLWVGRSCMARSYLLSFAYNRR